MIKQAFAFSFINMFLTKMLMLISVITVSRLLTPEELGVFAIATAIVGVAGQLKSFGVGSYLVREKEINKEMIQSALGLTFIVTWTLGIALLLSAKYLKTFYDIEHLDSLIYLLSVSFFAVPYLSLPEILLSRKLLFKKIMIAGVSSKLVAYLSLLVYISLDYSYFSLAFSSITGVVVNLIIIGYFGREFMFWVPSFKHMKKIANAGIYITLSNLLRRFSTYIPDLVIGKTNSTRDVAIFSRAGGLMEFISSSVLMGVRPVALPYLAEQNRKNNKVIDSYSYASLLIGGVVIPPLIVSGQVGEQLILLFFGSQWTDSVEFVGILSFWAALKMIHSFFPPLLITIKKEKTLFIKELIVFFVTATTVVSFIAYGLIGVAWALLISSLFDLILSTILLKKYFDITFLSFFYSQYKNLVLASICYFSTELLRYVIAFNNLHYVKTLLIVFLVNMVIWILSAFLLKHPISKEIMSLMGNGKR